MKKVYFLFCAVLLGLSSRGQTILLSGGDMEAWRTNIAGTTHPIEVEAPEAWYGADSLFIGLGQTIGTLIAPDTVWHKQLFKDTMAHSGMYSAKLITTYQDTLLFPGVLTNSKVKIGISLSPPGISGISYYGGTPVSMMKPTYVTAWVQYYPGKDIHGVTGMDTGLLTVEVLSHIAGIDSVVGAGIISILPCTSWTQITDSIQYTVDTATIDTIRVTFSSSAATVPMDSSTLFVDDVNMTGTPVIIVSHEGIQHVTTGADEVKVYPNPATGTIYITGDNTNLSFILYSINGKAMETTVLKGNNAIDVSFMPQGMYFYAILNDSGHIMQRGKITVVK